MKKGQVLVSGLVGFSFILFVAALYMIFIYAPTEKEMGNVQKIFYLMVPMGWLTLLSFLIIFISSIFYLIKRKAKWDIIAYSAAEVGIVFTTLALIAGSLWAKPTWGVWWDWGTPRLTSTLVLWFIYFAYFMARSLASEESQGARFAAVVGIVGFVDIPIVILSTILWQGMHPPALIFQEGGLDPAMMATLMVSLAAFTTLYCLLLIQRAAIRQDEVELEKLKKSSD